MSKRVSHESGTASKLQAVGHVGPADGETVVYYDITIICGCGAYAHVLLKKQNIPPAVDSLLASIRWDDPKLPIVETGRPLNEDKDDMKNKLQLQTLIQPHKGCTKAAWLESLDLDTGGNKKEGFLIRFDEARPQANLKDVLVKHPEMLTGQVAFLRQNSLVNRCHFMVFDSWKEEVEFDERLEN